MKKYEVSLTVQILQQCGRARQGGHVHFRARDVHGNGTCGSWIANEFVNYSKTEGGQEIMLIVRKSAADLSKKCAFLRFESVQRLLGAQQRHLLVRSQTKRELNFQKNYLSIQNS